MNKAEFEEKVAEFWYWTSVHDRKGSSWLHSLMCWSGEEYHMIRKQEKLDEEAQDRRGSHEDDLKS